ncbi:MAG: hypothetical protein ACI837_003145 [Crocinitomicaceae bacterium]|jgi:hypothetical protein
MISFCRSKRNYLLVLVVFFGCSGALFAQDRRMILVAPPVVDTTIYKYSVYMSRTHPPIYGNPMNEFSVNEYFYSANDSVEVVIPDSLANAIFSGCFHVYLKDGRDRIRSYCDYFKVSTDSATVYHSFEGPSLTTAEKHFKKEKRHKYGVFRPFHAFHDFYDTPTLHLAYHQGHRPFGEVSMGMSQHFTYYLPLITHGFTLGAEFNFRDKENFILGPKIGYNFSTLIFNVGVDFVYYTDFEKGSYYLKPRIGLNPLLSIVNISYSKGIPLAGNHFGKNLNAHQLSVIIIIPLKR